MGSPQTIQPTWALIKKPANYPDQPAAGKLELIYGTNHKSLHTRLSPYANYNSTLLKGFTTEPFYWISIEDAGKGLSGLKMAEAKYDSRMFPIGSAPIDVIRVAKFLGSGRGIPWLAKQFLLQTGNAFNETRIYNPTSPLIAAGSGLGVGLIRPQRNFDTSAGLAGIASTLIGSSIPNAILGEPKVNKPFGTAPDALLEGPLETSGGKGLIRAGTAKSARAHLEAAWPPLGKGLSTNKSFSSIAKSVFSTVFNNFIPQTQPGIRHRSDEGAYGLMIGGGMTRFSSTGATGREFKFGQVWVAGGKTMRKEGQVPHSYKAFITYDSNGMRGYKIVYAAEGFDVQVTGLGSVGYRVAESTDANKPGYRYGDNVGSAISDPRGDSYTNSDIMLQYKEYIDPKEEFPTKRTDQESVSKQNVQLLKVLQKLKTASGGLYSVGVEDDARVISSGLANKRGYDRLFAANAKGKSPMNFPDGVMKDYRNVTVVDNSLTNDIRFSKKLPTAGHFDAINTLSVLGKDMKIKDSKLKGWDKWEPYEDDQIAFYFYDVVNEKYIPFRAAIKGLSESSNASWEEMPFIGRGDKVYSYGGFNRNASLGINIVIGSLAELAPTWQRINYLTTLVKPANYTTADSTADYNKVINSFMVPPMVMMTIGDLYKDQPILIQSITTAIPDDASWETQNEFNSTQWEHLASYMHSSKVKYGQLPRTVDITLGLVLLEKERAMVGGANFGHAPRDEQMRFWNTKTVPNGGGPSELHKSFVVTKDNQKIFTPEQYYDNRQIVNKK